MKPCRTDNFEGTPVAFLPCIRHWTAAPVCAHDRVMRIDHLVWYTADLQQGRRFFAERLEAEPLYGGEHTGEGTANALLSLGSQTYLEILGRDAGQSEEVLDPEVRSLKGAGLYHWAVGGVDLTELAARARRAGLPQGAMSPGGRVKPDGNRLDWVCWGLRDHGFGALLPFFIDWGGSRHPATTAPPGGSLVGLELHSPNAARLRSVLEVLDLDVSVREALEPRVVATIEGARGTLSLTSFTPLPRGYVI